MNKTTKRRVARIGPRVNEPPASMTLVQAIERFPFPKLDREFLKRPDQERAFRLCQTFLCGIPKNARTSYRHSTYGLKHIVEDPRRGLQASSYGVDDERHYNGYIYEGTLLLAALSLGFTARSGPERAQRFPNALPNAINISEVGLRKRCRELVALGKPLRMEAA